MNRKLLKKRTSGSSEQSNYSGLFYPLSSNWNLVYFQKDETLMRDVLQVAQKSNSKQNKRIRLLSCSECYYCMEHIYRKQVGKAELSYSRCFLVDDWAFLSSRYYSWEVGKERRKLRVMGSARCIAQSLHRPLLPSEVHYVLRKFWRIFRLESTADLTTEQNQDASLL